MNYQELAARTINRKLTNEQLIVHAITGLCAQAGQVASMLQHALQQDKAIDTDKMSGELGDVQWFIAELCTALGINEQKVRDNNIEKLKKRYPEGFDKERSEHRHEYGED